MPHEDWHPRIVETHAFILMTANQDQNPHGALFAMAYEDFDRGASDWEKERIVKAMNMGLGSRSTSEQRKLRSAIILMRTAILRHEVSKAESETKSLDGDALAGRFNAFLRDCAFYLPRMPHRLRQHTREAEQFVLNDQVRNTRNGVRAQRLRDELQRVDQDVQENQRFRQTLVKRVYLPVHSTDDAIDTHVELFNREGMDVVQRGQSGLNVLQATGGELYIVGHGNFGSGIGSHDEYLGARRLVTALAGDQLPARPSLTVWIYLWSCWTATHTRRALGGIGKREPFIRRFARALAEQGFSNYYVVGFAGSVAGESVKQDVEPPSQGSGGQALSLEDYYSVYEVRDGDFNRIVGKDWTSKAFKVSRNPFDKELQFTVRQRGGKHNAT
jgi:hypothetical protein